MHWGARRGPAGAVSSLVTEHLRFSTFVAGEDGVPVTAQQAAGGAARGPAADNQARSPLWIVAALSAMAIAAGAAGAVWWLTRDEPPPAAQPTKTTARPSAPAAPQPTVAATAEATAITSSRPLAAMPYIQFAVGSAHLGAPQIAQLETARDELVAKPNIRIHIEGHTDPRGAEKDNATLSARRAREVLSWLVAHKIAPNRLSASACSARYPRSGAGTVAALAKNRRVELHTGPFVRRSGCFDVHVKKK